MAKRSPKLFFASEEEPEDAEKEKDNKDITKDPASENSEKEEEEEDSENNSIRENTEDKKEKKERAIRKEEVFTDIEEQKKIGDPQAQIAENIKIKHKEQDPGKKIERAPTGIPGLDDIIERGLKKNSVTSWPVRCRKNCFSF